MSETKDANPRGLVFTTMVWDQAVYVADFDRHLQRLVEHARRLRIPWPADFQQRLNDTFNAIETTPSPTLRKPAGLLRLEVHRSGEVTIKPRSFSLRNEPLEAIAVAAPRWSPKINGTKHGDWAPYREAVIQADKAGADIALLIHEFAIVDADRATPIVFDEDGTAWLAEVSEGGVYGITAEVLAPLLEKEGIPIQRGKLNERLVARSLEMVAVGAGVGVAQIEAIDGEPVGSDQGFARKCQYLLSEHYQDENTWIALGA
jgi:branched-subunit amino acid aminotransferase/4-amino-4-deoxychorismate lyase